MRNEKYGVFQQPKIEQRKTSPNADRNQVMGEMTVFLNDVQALSCA